MLHSPWGRSQNYKNWTKKVVNFNLGYLFSFIFGVESVPLPPSYVWLGVYRSVSIRCNYTILSPLLLISFQNYISARGIVLYTQSCAVVCIQGIRCFCIIDNNNYLLAYYSRPICYSSQASLHALYQTTCFVQIKIGVIVISVSNENRCLFLKYFPIILMLSKQLNIKTLM